MLEQNFAATTTNPQAALFNPDAALREAERYHPPRDGSGRFPWITWNWCNAPPSTDEKMHQKPIPAERLSWLIRQIAATRPNWKSEHHWIVQNEFRGPNRRALNLWSFGLCWVDIDFHKSHYFQTTQEIDAHTRRLLADCTDAGIPEPSIIVWSGRGLHVKWVLDKPLSAAALPRWNAVQRTLASKLQAAGWPVDSGSSDASRILRIVGTWNPGYGSSGLAHVVHEGPDYDFETLCEYVLPYHREQVAEFRRDAQARAEALAESRKVWQNFDENRQRAQELLGHTISKAAQAAQEAEQSLHWRRLEVIRQAAISRGGIAPGQRNTWMWIAANSLAWGLGDAGKLWLELPQLAREIAPTLSWAEVQNSASSVYARLKQDGRDGLYRMRTDTLIEKLGLSDDEARGLRGAGHGTKNPGVMGLPKLRDLDFDQWREEVHRRFQKGGQYSASVRDESVLVEARRAAQEAQAQARSEASSGLRELVRKLRTACTPTAGIVSMLDGKVSERTVRYWCADLPPVPRGGPRRPGDV